MGADSPPTTRQIAEIVLFDAQERTRLFSYARSRFGIAADDAEDLLQETALQLLRRQQSVHNARGFVFAVFRARCSRFIRAHRARSRTFEEAGFAGGDLPHGGGAEQIHRQLALRQALREISSSCRRILSAYYVEGESLKEAAVSVELAVSGAFKTISRCLKKLRRCLS